jgi:lysophospholipase L1-like esterase
MSRSARMNFQQKFRTPIRRIATATAFAVVSTSCDKLGLGGDKNPAGPSGPPAPGSSVVYTAIGASDANGVGSSAVCLPFTDCPNGNGYVPVAVRTLQAQGFTVTLRNLGIPTAVIGRDFQTLGQQYGRTVEGNFIEHEMPFVLSDSTQVTVFAGGNEVNTITAALGGGAGGTNPIAFIDQQVKAFSSDVTALLNGVKEKAPSARLVIINIPNMAGLPYLLGASLEQRQAAQRAAVAMTTTVLNPLASQKVAIVDAMCDARSYQSGNYSSDGLHPNDTGYRFLAAEVVRAITSTSYPLPQASCTFMTVVSPPAP